MMATIHHHHDEKNDVELTNSSSIFRQSANINTSSSLYNNNNDNNNNAITNKLNRIMNNQQHDSINDTAVSPIDNSNNEYYNIHEMDENDENDDYDMTESLSTPSSSVIRPNASFGSSSNIRGNSNKNSNNTNINKRQRMIIKTNQSTTSITIALCFGMIVHSYLLISVFPYSPFMAIELLPIGYINEDTAGTYAGLIASSFMIGRCFTAYQWGIAADTYGRIPVLYCSLLLSCIFSLLFGFVTKSFSVALFIRFLLGCSNGMFGACKTIVSELDYSTTTTKTTTKSNNNITYDIIPIIDPKKQEEDDTNKKKKAETKNMGCVMGMWAWGFLVAPAFSGAVAEPVKQYYNNIQYDHDHNNWISTWLSPETNTGQFLRHYPFIIPNIVGSILCCIGVILVYLYIPETLPESVKKKNFHRQKLLLNNNQEQRSFFPIIWKKFQYLFRIDESSSINENKQQQRRKQKKQQLPKNDQEEEMTQILKWHESDDEDDDAEVEMTRRGTQKITNKKSTTKDSDVSHNNNLNDHNNNTDRSRKDDHDNNNNKEVIIDDSTTGSPTIRSLLSKSDSRNCLIIYWLYSFINVAGDEILPLFLVSKTAGFGVTELKVGQLLSACGLIFAIGQYSISNIVYHYYGTYGSIRIGISLLAPIILLVPLSLLINQHYDNNIKNDIINSSNNNENVVNDYATTTNNNMLWITFWFLAILLSMYKLMALVFFTSISIAINHTVSSSERASINGLSVLGGSISKGLGPAFAGILATKSVQYFHEYASIIMFGIMSLISFIVAISVCYLFPRNDKSNNKNNETNNNITNNKNSKIKDHRLSQTKLVQETNSTNATQLQKEEQQ